MALISELVTELSVMSGIEKSSIAVLARHLREAGLLSQRGRGRGAAHATPLDAARLCIALMVEGKAKDAPEAVMDFGSLVCARIETESDHQRNQNNLASLCGLASRHTFEEGLAGLIAVWSDERAVAAMEEARGPLGFWPGMIVQTHHATLSAEIRFGVTHYLYHHAALLEERALPRSNDSPGSEGWWAHLKKSQELTTRHQSVARKYFSGIRSTREISGVEIMPLGEVVAGDRPAGYRESDEELARELPDHLHAFRGEEPG